jgi:HD-like signal output (HDOD) protein
MACLCLNRTLNLGFQGEEFTAGLLHDFGRTLIAVADESRFKKADSLTFEEDENILLIEDNILGTDHCKFGAWFAATNGLPDALVAAVRWHHSPAKCQTHRKLVALTAAADHIANFLQTAQDFDGYDTTQNPGINVLGDLGGCTQLQFSTIANSVMIEVEQISQDSNSCSLVGAS